MKIGIDCRLWNESGVGRYTRNLVLHLQELDKKNDYVLFALNRDIDEIKFQISRPKDDQSLAEKFQIAPADIRWHSLKEQTSFANVLNAENLDLVHFPYFSVPVFYRKPFVVTVHDLILSRFPTGKASTLPLPLYLFKHIGYQFVIAQAVARARKVITVSESTKKEIQEQFSVPKNKIEVIYEGVDGKISNIKSQISNKDPLYKLLNTKYFLYVGNAYPHKNLDILIQAFQKLQEEYKDVSLVLVGKEDHFYRKLKEDIKRLHLETKIVFYGFATDEELHNLYKNALSLVLPSKMEGFGLPLLEALNSKCLVIASDIPVFREIGKDAVVYFNPTKWEDLLEKMQDIYSHNKNYYSDLIEKGLARSKEFSWKKMAKETLSVYNDCL